MCKDKEGCLSCINDKIDNIISSIDKISEKLERLDKIVTSYDGVVCRLSGLEKLVTSASWIIGVLFVAITSIFFKLIFKV